MVDFRKWLFALAIVALFLGTSVSAHAQGALTCNVTAGVPPLVRAEGEAELVGDIVLKCTGGTPVTGPVPGVNIAVFLNAGITNKTYSNSNGATDALLLLDEPGNGTEVGCPPNNAPATCGVIGNGSGVDYKTTFNVWQGKTTTIPGAPQAAYMSFAGVPIDAPGTSGVRTIRITNLRANVTQIGVGIAGVPGAVTATVSITSPSSISIPSTTVQVGYVAQGMSFQLYNGSLKTDAIGFANCNGSGIGGNWNAFARFSEGFPSSFKRKAINGLTDATSTADGTAMYLQPQPTSQPQDIPGLVSFTESGYIPVGPVPPADAGAANSGTRLLLRFGNIPSNVTIYASLVERTAYANATPQAWSRVHLLTGTDDDGSGDTQYASADHPNNINASYLVKKVTSGATLTYEVDTDDPNVVEHIDIPLLVVFGAASGQPTPPDQMPTINGSLGPVDISSDMNGHTWIPRFKENGGPTSFFSIAACETNILFPWVASTDSWDTGIAIVNTSQDVFGTKAQQGTCTVNYFGTTDSGGALPPAATTTADVKPGQPLAFVLSTGNDAVGIPGVPGFLGYLIVQCNFQYAHGYAYISNGPIEAGRGTSGYLGLILDQPGQGRNTGNTSEALNQ